MTDLGKRFKRDMWGIEIELDPAPKKDAILEFVEKNDKLIEFKTHEGRRLVVNEDYVHGRLLRDKKQAKYYYRNKTHITPAIDGLLIKLMGSEDVKEIAFGHNLIDVINKEVSLYLWEDKYQIETPKTLYKFEVLPKNTNTFSYLEIMMTLCDKQQHIKTPDCDKYYLHFGNIIVACLIDYN